jgi:hypothetical protein
VTIRIPRWVLLGLAALVVLAGVGYGGYMIGTSKGADDEKAKSASRLEQVKAQQQEKTAVATQALLTHHTYELAQLRQLCVYAGRLRSPYNNARLASPNDCRAITPDPGTHVTIYGHDDRMTDVIGQVCENVALALAVDIDNTQCHPDGVEPLSDPALEAKTAAALGNG